MQRTTPNLVVGGKTLIGLGKPGKPEDNTLARVPPFGDATAYSILQRSSTGSEALRTNTAPVRSVMSRQLSIFPGKPHFSESPGQHVEHRQFSSVQVDLVPD